MSLNGSHSESAPGRNVPKDRLTSAEQTPLAGLKVGEWLVEPGLNQISSAGKALKLEPKVMSVLVALAQRPAEVVSREELLSVAWPGVIVGDDSLTQVVIKLRKALGDDRENAAYIQTIAKRGYRLVAPVTPNAAPPGPRQRRWPVALAVSVAMLAAAGAWWAGERRTSLATPAAAGEQREGAATAGPPTLAVKSFEAIGNDPQAVLLAQGLTSDLVTDLSKVMGLQVISALPSATQRGYVVSGTVQRDAERLRVNVNLAEEPSGRQLWSERFERPLAGFFAIQEELGPKILRILPAKVSEAELRRVSRRHTRNLQAYESFQRGQAALLVRQRASNDTARAMFREAIALDATFARAYAGLALTYAAEHRNQWSADGPAALARAFEMARTAHEMNPDIPETYWVLALVHVERREHAQALQYLRSALELYPSFADGYALMGGVQTYVGEPAQTVPLLRTAMRLNPEAGYLYFLLLGRAYLFLGDLEQARVNLEHALSRNPPSLEAHVYMAALLVKAGDPAAAAWHAEEIRALQPGFSARKWITTYPMTDVAQQRMLLQSLATLGL
jgi:DNA-binding winged helix-turn-helix (wHTH) protein/TolB-like protein/Tfp pilus assembly protein PilF